jgi:hypothetical protein
MAATIAPSSAGDGLVVVGGARQAHQSASFGDGEATGPVMMTDVLALLRRGVLFRAPFKNSISTRQPTPRFNKSTRNLKPINFPPLKSSTLAIASSARFLAVLPKS